jgi:hypothetical protein
MDSKDFERGVKDAESAGESLSNKLGKLGQGMTAGITLPIMGAAAAALKFSTDLNSSMANIASLGVANDRVTELKGNIQDMAVRTGKSTDDLAQGAYQVISAFGDTAERHHADRHQFLLHVTVQSRLCKDCRVGVVQVLE